MSHIASYVMPIHELWLHRTISWTIFIPIRSHEPYWLVYQVTPRIVIHRDPYYTMNHQYCLSSHVDPWIMVHAGPYDPINHFVNHVTPWIMIHSDQYYLINHIAPLTLLRHEPYSSVNRSIASWTMLPRQPCHLVSVSDMIMVESERLRR